MNVTCNCGESMELTDTDSRQEWREETYVCPSCDLVKIRRTEFSQNGLVTKDELYDAGDEEE